MKREPDPRQRSSKRDDAQTALVEAVNEYRTASTDSAALNHRYHHARSAATVARDRFHNLLVELKRDHGWTYRELSDATGLSVRNLNNRIREWEQAHLEVTQ